MFTSIFQAVMNEPSVAPVYSAYMGFQESLGAALPIILMLLCLFVGMFGRRNSGLIRVLLLFSVGFVASVYWVAPVIQNIIPAIPALAIGIAVGIFLAVMSRMIYDFVYIGCIGFDTYNICFNAMFVVEITSLVKGNLPVCIGIAVAVTFIALILRKYLEMLLTAGLGGIGVAFFFKSLFDYTTLINLDQNTAIVLVGAVVAIPMFIYQYYNRVIY